MAKNNSIIMKNIISYLLVLISINANAQTITEQMRLRVPTVLPSGDSSYSMPINGAVKWNSTPLQANQTYTTNWIKIEPYLSAKAELFTSHASATNGYVAELTDDTTQDDIETVAFTINTVNAFQTNIFPLRGNYYRLSFTNGSTPQTRFFLKLSFSTQQSNSAANLFAAVSGNQIGGNTKSTLFLPNTTNLLTASFTPVTQKDSSMRAFVDSNTQRKLVNIGNFPTTQPISGTVTTTPPTITKGTQGSTGFTTQDLKDAGRVSITYTATGVTASGTEALVPLTKSSGTSANTAASSFNITNGKRFRIQSILIIAVGNLIATPATTTFSIRLNTSGAATATSTPVIFSSRVVTAATSLAVNQLTIFIPDGYEILGTSTLQFGISAISSFALNAPTFDISVIGYEY